MNYESQNELLSAYLDGELTAEERTQVEHLLATKPGARKMLEELRALSATLQSLPRQKVGEDLSHIVLRTAELRMLTEPADGEKTGTDTLAEPKNVEEHKMRTDIAEDPSPIYSTILRRLKNPRMWVWEIVIVAVAVMLVVYYPIQNANRNIAPSGNAERNIAMATKGEKKPVTLPQSSMRAAPSPATVDMKEGLDVQIVRGKRSDSTRKSGVAAGEKQSVATGVSEMADKQPAPDASTLVGKQSVAPNVSTLSEKRRAAPSASTPAEPAARAPAEAPAESVARAPAEPAARAPAEAPAMQKLGEEVGKTDVSGRLEGLEKPAEGKSVPVPEMPARDLAELGKKDSTTFGGKLATKDTLEPAKGATSAGEIAAPTPPPGSGHAIQSQSKSGTAQIAQNINASEAPSQIKPAQPPAGKEPADRAKGKDASADELLVVRCEITPEALKNHAFDKILADNAIVWSETQKEAEQESLNFKNPPNKEAIQSLFEAKTDLAANKPERFEQSKVTEDNIALSKEAPLELVYVEASPAQIQSMLNGLSSQTEAFKTVSVAPAKGDSRFQYPVAGYDNRGLVAGAVRGGRVDAAQSVETMNGSFQADFKSDLSSSAGVVLGRAQRIPFSYVNNAKAAGVETEAIKQNPARIAQKGLPATRSFGGGGSAGLAGKSRSGGKLGVAAAAPATGSRTAEQLKSSAPALNEPAAKAEQQPTATAATQLLTNQNQEQAANKDELSASAAPSREMAKQERHAASAPQNRQDVDSLRRNFRIEPSGTAALPRIERVLFVLQVIGRKDAAETADQKAPADAAGIKAPAAEANPSKP